MENFRVDSEEILKKLINKEIKLYEIENYIETEEAVKIRRKYIEHLTNQEFKYIKDLNFDPTKVYKTNCENVIGAVSLPVGVAGPVKVKGKFADGEFIIPLATTEGALIASINRGTKIINLSGGATTTTVYHGITRAPVYKTKGIRDSENFVDFVEKEFPKLQELTINTDRFIKLTKFSNIINGRSVWLRFHFDTTDAMGMNMAVKATKVISDYIEEKSGTKVVAISGNVCVDKKPSLINTILGRGRTVMAEVKISEQICREVLKCEVDDIIDVSNRKIWQGSTVASSIGYNSHIANVVSAIFIATGQDPAHVVDASTGMTTFEKDGDGLYMCVKIPTLNVATVGGGTSLRCQNELINLLLTNLETKQVIIENKTAALSEIIGAAVLAGELSLVAAFANNTFVKAHEELGRQK